MATIFFTPVAIQFAEHAATVSEPHTNWIATAAG